MEYEKDGMLEDIRLQEKDKKENEVQEKGEAKKLVEEGEEIPNADRREGAPPLVRAMPCRDRPVES